MKIILFSYFLQKVCFWKWALILLAHTNFRQSNIITLDSSHEVMGKIYIISATSITCPNWGHTTKGIWSSFAQTVVHCVAIRLPIDVQLVKKLHTVHQNAKNLTGKPINPNVVLTNWLQIQKGKDFMCSFRT